MVAVDGVDLDIEDGEFFSMLGPSGSGKTTVLRMIAGFEQPDRRARSSSAARTSPRRPPFERDVNTVFQDYALFPHMSVLQNVEYGLRVKKVGKAERRQRAAEALATGAARAATATAGPTSSPAASGSGSPSPAPWSTGRKVLLLDEPLGALDLKLREQMQVELKAIQREVGITFVFVTHDQEEALTMCDRIAVFNDGRIEQVGTAREIYEQPATAFVAGFVGTSNLLAGGGRARCWAGTAPFGIRPEKIRIVDRPAARGRHRRPCARRAPSPRSSTPARSPASSSTSTPGAAHRPEQNGHRDAARRAHVRGAPVDLLWRRDATSSRSRRN